MLKPSYKEVLERFAKTFGYYVKVLYDEYWHRWDVAVEKKKSIEDSSGIHRLAFIGKHFSNISSADSSGDADASIEEACKNYVEELLLDPLKIVHDEHSNLLVFPRDSLESLLVFLDVNGV